MLGLLLYQSVAKLERPHMSNNLQIILTKPDIFANIAQYVIDHPSVRLLWACQRGYSRIAKLMLQFDKINVNAYDKYEYTALTYAAKNGLLEVCKMLLGFPDLKYAIVDEYTIDLLTPLHAAIKGGHFEICQMLVQYSGTDYGIKYNGHTPFVHSAGFESLEIFDMLNRNHTTKEYGIALELASEAGHVEIVKKLVKLIPENEQMYWNETSPLFDAVHKEHFEVCQVLVAYPWAGLNSINSWNEMTPLHRAVQLGNLEITKLLLDQPNIDVNIRDNDGQQPLHIAADYGGYEIFMLLITRPDIEIDPEYAECNERPLWYAGMDPDHIYWAINGDPYLDFEKLTNENS